MRLLPFSRQLLFLLLLVSVYAFAQQRSGEKEFRELKPAPPNAPVVSPEVHADNTVTFRFPAPNAQRVELSLEGFDPQAMRKDDQGVWAITTSALAPDYYGYSFVADGVRLIDPSNPALAPNLLATASALHVPGPSTLPWEVNDIPHGEIHHHFYKSAVAEDNRDYYVYTPPNYDPAAKQSYPVLYLLHGFSDDASGWTAVGHANVILDNLIARGKAKPMIVVMPLGYGSMEFVLRGWNAWSNDKEMRNRNFDKFREALLTEVVPQVESEYHIARDRNARAIAGLSMGGAESLLTGLNNLDKFSWVGAFSSGIPEDFEERFPSLDTKANQKLHLLWIACGTEDSRITLNRKLRDWLTGKQVKHIGIETPGMHTWMVWRRNLAEFAQLIFQ